MADSICSYDLEALSLSLPTHNKSIEKNPTAEYPGKVASNSYGQYYFAARDIEIGTVVERFIGKEVKYEEVPESEIIYAACCGNGIWVIPMTNVRYINHSCHPNCKINGAGEMVAIKAIPAGEEITFDYVTVSKEEWQKAPKEFFWDSRWSFDCQCGAPNCRGRIDRYFIKD